jgi:outer membrane scaffolding protein for murein synthesis (MipA/OmpV family)
MPSTPDAHGDADHPAGPIRPARFRRAHASRRFRRLVAVAGVLTLGPLPILLSGPTLAQEAGISPDNGSPLGGDTLGATPTPDAKTSTFLGKGTSITLGLGPDIAPAYEGAKNFKVAPFPYIEVKGLFDNRVFLSTTRGLGVNVLEFDNFQAGLSISYGGGRTSSDSPRLKGLSDISGAAVGSAFASYELKPFAVELKAENSFGPNPGTQASLGLSYAFSPAPKLHVSMGPQVTWADSRYDKSYFGVAPSEAARATAAGNPMSAYSPGAGIKDVGMSITGAYQVTRHWGLVAHVGLSDLVGSPARDSPLTQRSFQPSAAIGGTYRF